jgi:hypothetical protein
MSVQQIARELRDYMLDRYEGKLLAVELAWEWLEDNPKYFGFDGWTENLPIEPPDAFIAAYYGGVA